MHKYVVGKAARFVVGDGVLVKEHERVDLADGEGRLAQRVALGERDFQLVPGLGRGELRVVRVIASKAVLLAVPV